MSTLEEIENRAAICRVTSGWKKASLSLEAVRRYWRDVHSPAIARRAGVYDYRHYQFDAVRADVLAPVPGVEQTCTADAQLMWTSDVRYADEAGLEAFGRSPDGIVKAQLLQDIELIVDRSTTYKVVGANGFTYVDSTGIAMPQGPVKSPTYSLFIRQRSDEPSFRRYLQSLAERWSKTAGVSRIRLSLFEVPDMEAERKAGYPVKTHPLEQQYQAWIDLAVQDDAVLKRLMTAQDHADCARHVRAIHAYPVLVIYTSVYAGHPTMVGLRGYPAYDAIQALDAQNAREHELLEWMYGPVAVGAYTGDAK